jgi:hypothetical protein
MTKYSEEFYDGVLFCIWIVKFFLLLTRTFRLFKDEYMI